MYSLLFIFESVSSNFLEALRMPWWLTSNRLECLLVYFKYFWRLFFLLPCDCAGPKEFTLLFYSLQSWRVCYIQINSFTYFSVIDWFYFKLFITVLFRGGCFQEIFERYDRDRSGKIDASELRDALYGLGFSVSPVILDMLVSKFDKTGGRSKAIEYDNFIE